MTTLVANQHNFPRTTEELGRKKKSGETTKSMSQRMEGLSNTIQVLEEAKRNLINSEYFLFKIDGAQRLELLEGINTQICQASRLHGRLENRLLEIQLSY